MYGSYWAGPKEVKSMYHIHVAFDRKVKYQAVTHYAHAIALIKKLWIDSAPM